MTFMHELGVMGFILKDRCILGDCVVGIMDMLEEEYDMLGDKISKEEWETVVGVFLSPDSNEGLWTDPQSWELEVYDREIPTWFRDEKDKYVAAFKDKAKEWWLAHVKEGTSITEINSGVWVVRNCDIDTVAGDAYVWVFDSKIQAIKGNTNSHLIGCTRVECVSENARVLSMFDTAEVVKLVGDASVIIMNDDSVLEGVHSSEANKHGIKDACAF